MRLSLNPLISKPILLTTKAGKSVKNKLSSIKRNILNDMNGLKFFSGSEYSTKSNLTNIEYWEKFAKKFF